MLKTPKLKIKMPYHYEAMRNLEETKEFFLNWGIIALVDGQAARSYEELVKLVTQDRYKDRKIIEVMLMPIAAGG